MVKKSAVAEVERAASAQELEAARVKYLGRKGEITGMLRTLKDMPLEERKNQGPKLHTLKRELENLIEKKKREFENSPVEHGAVDITKPGKEIPRGHLHPLTLVEDEICRIFSSLNFAVVEGPEIESEHYNFDALNIPADHPARDMWDTFWLKNNQKEFRISNFEFRNSVSKVQSFKINSKFNPVIRRVALSNDWGKIQNSKLLLRTHTSPVQVRYMESHEPPFQIIVPGRVFRYEATDASHEINFYQFEGLMVGRDISLANFKFVIAEFLERFFRRAVEFRLRPSYFPFTEPSVEVDVKWGKKWLECMGAGMVHRKVFEAAGYNPRDWQGFAFGGGIDRFAMIKYNIPDIRMFYSGDLRFVRQF